ncbi:MAG: RNA-binding protein [Bacteroidetes bacterium]|nr:RNA-binding protein [Bacteroidota bacterium]
MKIGQFQHLTIKEKNTSGYILENSESENCFIPKIFAEDDWEIGSTVEVFVYQDDGVLKATTEIPLAQVGEFAVMKCIQNLPAGAFLDWGIIKDIFVPYKEQKGKMLEGKRYLIYVYIDEKTGLITGTNKYKRNPQYQNLSLKKGEKVDLLIAGESEIGWNVVINKKYLGLVYSSDVFKKLYPLSEEVGYIKSIREDGKIDVTLQPEGFENIDEFRKIILDKLTENYGLLYLSDKSTPEEIKEELGMSKKNFKKAIGGLYKDNMIEILEDKIRSK